MDRPANEPARDPSADASIVRSERDRAPTRDAPGAKAAAPIGLRCLACGSHDLDTTEAPRGDDPVRCCTCDTWSTFLQLEMAAVEAVRRDRARRCGA
ncbi:hypothetical protein [Dokdonella sp.]|uniref:hypothetical protein n=1 Tax=Dokdonella sp. TaxID=2291710 RepID=UPI002F3E4A54